MLNQFSDEVQAFFIRPSNDFVRVGGNIHCFAAGGVVLDQGVERTGFDFEIVFCCDVCWVGYFAGVPEGVVEDKIV